MSFSDWTKKRKQNQQQQGAAGEATPAASGAQATAPSAAAPNIARDDKPNSFSEWTRKRKDVTAWRGTRMADYDSWVNDLNAFTGRLQTEAAGRTGYQSQDSFRAYRGKTDTELDKLMQRGMEFQDYFTQYGGLYDGAYRREDGGSVSELLLDSVGGGLDTLKQARKSLEDEANWWAQFEDEAAYTAYKRVGSYDELPRAADFAEKSKYQEKKTEREMDVLATLATSFVDPQAPIVWKNSGWEDPFYAAVNGDEEARAYLRNQDNTYGASGGALGHFLDSAAGGSQETAQMTDDEVALYNYIYATQSPEAARQYIEDIASTLNLRQRQSSTEKWGEYATEHPVGASVFSIMESPLKGLAYIGQAVDYAVGGKIDQNAGWNKFSYVNSAIREQVSQDVEKYWVDRGHELGGKAASLLYQTGMSMGDFLLNTGISGGNQAVALAIMGTGAAADATISAKDRGLSDGQAFALGTIAGIAEIVTEKVSLEALLKPDWEKGTLNYIIKNALSEGSEEVGSDVINLLADLIISKGKSELVQSVQAYMADGIPEGEAVGKALFDQAINMGVDFLGGAISGGVMSGVAGVGKAVSALNQGRQFQDAGLSAEDIQAFVGEGLARDPSTQAYTLAKAAEQKLQRGGTLTNYELGNLYQANERAIGMESEAGELLEQAARDTAEGKRLTNRTARTILESPSALSMLTQETGLTIQKDMSKSQQRNAVREAVRALTGPGTTISQQGGQVTQPAAQKAVEARGVAQGVAQQTRQAQRAVPAAELALRQKQMESALESLGPQGREQGKALFDGASQNPVEYYGGFVSYYNAGVSGLDIGKVRGEYTGALNEPQRQAAYLAGKADAAASLAAEKAKVNLTTVYGEEAGFIPGDYDDMLDGETVTFLGKLGKATGTKIQIVAPTGEGAGAYNGRIANGVIEIAADAQNPFMAVATHEITHRMQELAPEQYRAYRNYVMQALGERAQEQIDGYKARYAQIGQSSDEAAMDEIAADFTADLLRDVEGFRKLADTDRSVARRLLDAVRDFIEKVKAVFRGEKAQNAEARNAYGMDMATLEEAARLWGKALEATKEQTDALQKNAARADGEAKFSIKRTSKMTLAQQLKLFYDGKMLSSDAFYFGETPGALGTAGLDPLPLAFTMSDFRKSSTGKHNVPRRVWKNLHTSLENALFAFRAGDRVGIMTGDIDGDGKPLLVGIERNAVMDRKPVNAIRSVYGLDTPGAWLQNQIKSGKEYIPMNKERADAFLQTYGAYSATVGDGIRSLDSTVTQEGGDVKERFSLKSPVEETRDLIALHNKDEGSILAALELGGLPMPSIAVVKAEQGHSKYGPISLVFGKDTIDPQFSRANKVYGGDAWTPTAPQVDYSVDSKKAGEIERELQKLSGDTAVAGGIFGSSSVLRSAGIEDTSSMDAAGLAEKLAATDAVRAAYLAEQGKTLEPVMMDKVWDAFGNDTLEKVIDRLGVETLAEMEFNLETGENVETALGENTEVIRDIIREHYQEMNEPMLRKMAEKRNWTEAEIREKRQARLDKTMEGVTVFSLERTVRHAWEMYQDGGYTKGEIDRVATTDALRGAVDDHAVEKWIAGKLDGLLGEAGVYNGKDVYTASGNRRSFTQLHYAYTLENIVKAMKEGQEERGANAWGATGKTLQSVAAPEYHSIQEIKADSGRLGMEEGAAYEAKLQAIDDQIGSIITKVKRGSRARSDNHLIDIDIIGGILMEAANGKRTVDAIMRAFSKEGYPISSQTAQDIQAVYRAAAEMPTGYFEAKPQRAVGFDEVLAAVIPNDSSEKLREALAGRGVNVLTYESGDEADRLAKVNSVEGAKFSLKGGDAARREMGALEEENVLLREQLEEFVTLVNRKAQQADYWRGQTRRTKRITMDSKAVAKAARDLVKGYNAQMNAEDIRGDLQALYDYIASGYEGEEELTYEGARRRAGSIAQRIAQSSVEKDDRIYKEYKDLREYLRTTQLNIRPEDNEIPDFGAWRKQNFGRLRVGTKGTNIDQVYMELSERWPEFFNEARESTPADQLLHIAEVANTIYSVTEYNPFSYDMRQAVDSIANEILENFLNLPQTKATFADRQAAKLDEAKRLGRERVERLREEKNARIDALRKENRELVRQAVERERAAGEQKIQRLKEHNAQVRQGQAARRADNKARTRLLHIAQRLQNRKMTAANRALLDQYIGELDTVSKSMTGATVQKLTELREWYNDRKKNDPDFISDPATERKLERLAKRQIADLAQGEVAELTEVLLHIENELRTEKKLIDAQDRRDVYHMGEEVIRDIGSTAGSKSRGPLGALDTLLVTETLSPIRQIRRMVGYLDADPLLKMTEALADGQREMLAYQMRAEKPFERFSGDSGFTASFSGRRAAGIPIIGMTKDGAVEVTISPAMRASLYLHSLNDQNLRHIRDGGITVPDWELYKDGKTGEAYARGTTIKLTPSQVRAICQGMTEQEKAFAKEARRYFNEVSTPAINAVSEKLKGYPLAQVENYFPINTDTSFTKADFESIKFDGSIEGMGWTKERVNAANPILLRDVNSVLEQSIQQHGKYVGLAIPVRNFNKVWGVTTGSFNADGSRNNFESAVQKAVKQKWGESGYSYIEKMLTDLQSGKAGQKNAWAKVLSKVRSNYAGAVLTLNASVAMKQAASYPTAAAVLGWRPLLRAMGDTGKVDLDLIAKYTPLQWYRSKGYSTKELGDIAASGSSRFRAFDWMRGKDLPKYLNWVQGMDVLTTRKLWKASEYYIRDTRKDLARGTDAYYRAVAQVYDRVIEETQPNYTTMQRPQLLRADDNLLANLFMFLSQPFQNFNILYDASGNLAAKAEGYKAGVVGEAELREAKRAMGRAVTSQLAQAAVFAAMTAAWAFFRGRRDKYEDEETGEVTMDSFMAAFGKDMMGGLLSTVPFGSDVWEWVSSKMFGDRYYGMDVTAVTAISDTALAASGLSELVGSIFRQATQGEAIDWNATRLEVDGYIGDISKLAGVPYENIANLFDAAYRQACVAAMGQYRGEYAALKLTTDPAKHSADYYDLLYKAMKGDRKDYEAIYADMLEFGFDADKVSGAMEARMKKEQGASSVKELDRRYLPPESEAAYNATLRQISGSAVWKQANDDQRDKVEEILYDLATGSKKGAKTQEKIDGGAAYGIDETEYLLFRLALDVVDQPTESGSLGSYTGEEVEAAIDMLPGLDDEARAYLWEAAGKSAKSNPWG